MLLQASCRQTSYYVNDQLYQGLHVLHGPQYHLHTIKRMDSALLLDIAAVCMITSTSGQPSVTPQWHHAFKQPLAA